MRIDVLGPTRVLAADGRALPLERKAREVLAILALSSPAAVPLDELVEMLWDDPPAAANKAVQSHVSRIRAALRSAGLPDGSLETRGSGHYVLLAPDGALDVAEVVELRHRAREHRDAGRPDDAAALLGRAAAMWDGDVELPPTVAAMALATRWRQERRDLDLERLSALVAGGGATEAVGALEARVTAEPGDEPAWALLVDALRGAGRRTDALRAFQRARSALNQIGLEPGGRLRAAEAAALTEDAPPAAEGLVVRYAGPPGATVAYTALGDGDRDVLLLNPGVLSIDGLLDEPHLAAGVARLRGLGRLLTLDRRGIGLSDPLPDRLDPISTWVADSAAALDAAGATDVIVVASSDSGLVALALAAAHPALVRALVLVHAYPRYLRSADYPFGLDPTTAAATSADAVSVEPTRAARFDPLSSIAPSVAQDPAFRRWWDGVGRRAASPTTASRVHAAIQEADVRHLLAEVVAPTLLLHRRSCTSCDPGHARFLAGHLPEASLVWLDGADELWFTAGADELLDAVEGFVAGLPDRPR